MSSSNATIECVELDVISRSGQETTACAICLSDIDKYSMALNCGHAFHPDCYNQYVVYEVMHGKRLVSCPLCRETLVQIVVEGETSDTTQATVGLANNHLHNFAPDDICCICTWTTLRRYSLRWFQAGFIIGIVYLILIASMTNAM